MVIFKNLNCYLYPYNIFHDIPFLLLAANVSQIHAGREFPDELPTKICTLNY